MKVDLHLHSKYSVRPSQWILQKLGCPESFSEPEALYRITRNKGMDLVTISDHNTIAGALEIAHLPGAFVSEEITTYFPEDGCKAHVLVYDIDEEIHRDVQKVRENIYDLVRYLDDAGLIHVLAHPFYAVNDKLTLEHFEKFILLFRNFELNGARDDYQNRAVRLILENLTPEWIDKLIERHGIVPGFPEPWLKNLTGGSDDHSALNVARHHTEVKGARTLDEFLLGVETHQAIVSGAGSDPRVMSHNLYGIAYQFYKRKLGFEKNVGRDPVLRFLDRCLQADPEEAGLFSRLVYSWKQKKTPRQAEDSRVEDQLRFEAHRILKDDPVLVDIMKNGNGKFENRAERWFHFVNQVSNKVLLHFWNSLISQLSGANFFTTFQSLGSAGALSTVLAPYFVTFSVFSRDRLFTDSALERFSSEGLDYILPEAPFKMAHFTDTFYEVNGVALTLQHQVKLARSSGKDLTVITCDAESRPEVDGVRNFTPIGSYELPEYPEQKLYLTPFLQMLDYCYKNRFTHIHTATPGPLGLASLAIARIMKTPLSGTYHTAVPEYASRLTGDGDMESLAWKYILWFYEQLDFILVPSMSTGNDLIARGISPEKIRLFPRGVDTRKFHPSKRDPAFMKNRFGSGTGLKILYAGRISKEKDLMLLGQAFKGLRQQFPDVELVLVGDGPQLDELKEFMQGTPCIFTGYMEGEDLSTVYASCDVFAFPSATDTFGNVVLEAQAAGLPVVVTDSGGPRENLVPNKTGFIVPAGDAESLRSALETLLSDAALRKQMGAAARRYMESRSCEKAFEETWRIYQGNSPQTGSAFGLEEYSKRKAA